MSYFSTRWVVTEHPAGETVFSVPEGRVSPDEALGVKSSGSWNLINVVRHPTDPKLLQAVWFRHEELYGDRIAPFGGTSLT